MSDQYIWDKTGSDAEIEALEDLLGSMRYVPVPAPELPVARAKRFSSSFWKISLGFAVPAAAMTIVLAVMWAPAPRDNVAVNGPAAPAAKVLVESPVSTQQTTAADNTPAAEPRAAYVKPVLKLKARARRPIERSLLAKSTKDSNVKRSLTPEEKFAYDQVRLALSISATQLKVVRDSVNNADEE